MAQARAISSPAPSAAANPLKAVRLSNVGELAVPIAVLLIVIALITPLPSFLLDILIVLDLMMSVIVMMVAMYIGRPVEFSVFPTVLLLLTLVPAGSERLVVAPHSAQRKHRDGRRRTRDRGVRQLRRGRQLHHRRGDFLRADRHSVRGHQPRFGAHFRSDRALHLGRPARQANVDRRRFERRPDRRNRSAPPPQRA